MRDEDLCFMSASELAAKIRARDVSPVEVTDAVLERIDQLNPTLNAFCTRMDDEARGSASEAEAALQRGDDVGPLHGVPVSIKDNIYVKGSRTTFGSKLLENKVNTDDAPAPWSSTSIWIGPTAVVRFTGLLVATLSCLR